MSDRALIDPDNDATWPAALRSIVAAAAESSDDEETWAFADDSGLRAALGNVGLVAYHATRLLPHEIEDIQTDGLALLTETLISRRLVAAVHHGYLSMGVATALESGNALRSRGGENRVGQACLIIGAAVFAEHPYGVRPLLSVWGGEGINFTEAAEPWKSELEALGTPVVVVIALPHTPVSDMAVYPSLLSVFVGTYRGDMRSADVFWRDGDIPGSCILTTWQPGDANYDRFEGLPHR